jgi:hypothetical protein
MAIFALMMVAAVGAGIGYSRFLILPVLVSPFMGGLLLWWLRKQALPDLFGSRRYLTSGLWTILLMALIGVATVQFYTYQPLVPKAEAIASDVEDEYVVWFHGVNTAYQQRMLTFAQTHTDPDTNFAIDYTGGRQLFRYFGIEATQRRGPYLPLYWQQPVDSRRVDLFLLHWPGPAGGLSESVENRSRARIQQLRETPEWGLIYDNGESFILFVDQGQ